MFSNAISQKSKGNSEIWSSSFVHLKILFHTPSTCILLSTTNDNHGLRRPHHDRNPRLQRIRYTSGDFGTELAKLWRMSPVPTRIPVYIRTMQPFYFCTSSGFDVNNHCTRWQSEKCYMNDDITSMLRWFITVVCLFKGWTGHLIFIFCNAKSIYL